MKSKIKNQSKAGFGIIEILIAVSILGVISLGVGAVLKDVLMTQRTGQIKLDADNFHEDLRTQMGSTQSCFNTLYKFPLTTSSQYEVKSIKDADPNPASAKDLYKLATTYTDKTFTISSIKFTYLSDDPSDPTSGIGELAVDYIAHGQSLGGGTLRDRKIKIKTKKDAANKMIECAALAKATDGIWHRSLSSFNDIYFSEGKVGIGTTSADQALTVAGGVHSTTGGFVFPNGTVMTNAPPVCKGSLFLQWVNNNWACSGVSADGGGGSNDGGGGGNDGGA